MSVRMYKSMCVCVAILWLGNQYLINHAARFYLFFSIRSHSLTCSQRALSYHIGNAAPFCQPDYIQAAKRRKWRRRRRRRRKLKPVCSFLRSFSIHSFAAIHSRSTNPKKCQQQETGRATSKAREAARTRSDRSLGLGRIWKRRTLNGYGTAMCVCVQEREIEREPCRWNDFQRHDCVCVRSV